MTVIGEGRWKYRVVDGWGNLPPEWHIGDVAGVAVDAQDRVFAFNRSEHPVIVMDRSGAVLGTWGGGVFCHAHGIHIAPDQTVYCTDDGGHFVSQHTLNGEMIRCIGTPGQSSGFHSGLPFCRCTHTALSPHGEIYVSDGYHNARVHKYSPDGQLLFSWGEAGIGPGQFNLPHSIACDEDGWVYVADRENHRIQVFDGNGKFETMWHGVHRPSALYMTPGPDHVFFVGELGPIMRFSRGAPNLGPRLSVLNAKGEVEARIGADPAAGLSPGQFLSPHGLAADSRGDLYIAEVSETAWPQLFPAEELPRPLRCLRKLERVTPFVWPAVPTSVAV